MKLTQEQASFVKDLNPAIRRWVCHCYKENIPFDRREIEKASKKEGNLYREELNSIIAEIKKVKLDYGLSYWIVKLEADISMKGVKIIAEDVKKTYLATELKPIGKLLAFLTSFQEDVKSIEEKIGESLSSGKSTQEALDECVEDAAQKEIKKENNLFVRQTGMHIKFLLKKNQPISAELLSIYLGTCPKNVKFAEDRTNVINKIYKSQFYTPEVKNVIYKYIETAAEAGMLNAHLVFFLIQDDWISQETFELFKNVYPDVKAKDMTILVTKHINVLIATLNRQPKTKKNQISLKYCEELYAIYQG